MKTLYTTIYYLLILGICSVGLLVIASMVPVPGNIAIKVVKSGSMEPSILTGSVIIDKPAASYEIGDVITFGADTKTQVPTTHRIVAQSGEGDARTFTVKGDANNAPDATVVHISDIHGKVIFTIPYLGFLLAFAKTKLGFFLLVGIPALVVCFEEAYKIYMEVRRMKRPGSGISNSGGMRSRPVMDLRGERREYTESEDSRRMPFDGMARVEISPKRSIYGGGRSIGMASLLVFVIGISVFSRYSRDTIAFYASKEMATGNSLTAAASYPGDTAPAASPLRTSLINTNTDEAVTPPTDDSSSTPPVTPPADDSSGSTTPDVVPPAPDTPATTTQEQTPPIDPPIAPPPPSDNLTPPAPPTPPDPVPPVDPAPLEPTPPADPSS